MKEIMKLNDFLGDTPTSQGKWVFQERPPILAIGTLVSEHDQICNQASITQASAAGTYLVHNDDLLITCSGSISLGLDWGDGVDGLESYLDDLPKQSNLYYQVD
ncbi:MAG: hypothetical protein U0525_05650 [Patescibacteria group bacterium]